MKRNLKLCTKKHYRFLSESSKETYILNQDLDLKYLSLRNCTTITDQTLSLIPKDCLNLDLSIHVHSYEDQLSNAGLKNLFLYCPCLESLDLYGRKHLSDEGFLNLGSSLRCLTLPGRQAKSLTFSTVEATAKACPQLTSLDASASAFPMNTFQGFERLQYLDLSFCPNIDRLSFQGMHSLKVLNLKGAEHLSEEMLIALCRQCPKLEKLYLSYCREITNRSICEILENLDHLQVLDLSRCVQITDQIISCLIQHKKKLKKINVIGCSIQKNSLLSFEKAYPFCALIS